PEADGTPACLKVSERRPQIRVRVGKAYRSRVVTVSPMSTGHRPEETTPVSGGQIAAFRLARHHLTTRVPASSLVKVTGDMAGAQAQVMSAGQMSLWTRTRSLRRSAVEEALWPDPTLGEVWCRRGTVE